MNCTNSKLSGENKSLKERLEKESEKCNDLTGHFQTLHETEAALSERSQEMVTLKKQLVSLHKFENDFEVQCIFIYIHYFNQLPLLSLLLLFLPLYNYDEVISFCRIWQTRE